MLSDIDILNLWKDPNFAGSYSGIRTFHILLKTDLNQDIPEKRLFSILKQEPTYLIHLKPKRRFQRRAYDVRRYGELIQGDIAYMFEFDQFKYFLTIIDVYSRKIYALPLKSKQSTEVESALDIIFKQFDVPIDKFETDQGSEFIGCKNFFKKQHIFFKYKFGQNKSNFAEHSIWLIKKKLYMLLRDKLTHDWVKYLPIVIHGLNSIPSKRLGLIRPGDVHSNFDETLIRRSQKIHDIIPFQEPKFDVKRQNQLTYEKNEPDFKIGTYVYLDFNQSSFDKSFDTQVSQCLKRPCH